MNRQVKVIYKIDADLLIDLYINFNNIPFEDYMRNLYIHC